MRNDQAIGITASLSGSAYAVLHRWGTRAVRFARDNPVAAIAALILFVLGFLAAFGPLISPFDPLEFHSKERFASPSGTYLMGTDEFGRDQLSRLIAGTRSIFTIVVVSVAIGVTAGALIGLISGYRGGWLDSILQRFMDSMMAIPLLVLTLAILAMLGRNDINVIGAIAAVNVPIANRVIRSATLSAKEELYVTAAKALGASDWRISLRHIGPNVLAPYLVVVTTQLSWAIIVASALSFLGVASPPPEPSWGRMMSEGAREFAERAPWLAVFPAVFVFLTVLSFNLVGDVLRDSLDPRLRGR